MQFQDFPESNAILGSPADMKPGECHSVHAYLDGKNTVVCFKPTPEERVRLSMGEPLYLHVLGCTMAPCRVLMDFPVDL